GDSFVAQALVHLVEVAEIFLQPTGEFRQTCAFELGRAFAVSHDDAIRRALQDDFVERVVVLDVLQGLALLDGVQWWLCDEHVATFDQLLHVTEEECQQQSADVASVHISVGHQDDLAVTQLGKIEVVFADAGAERRDHGANFFVPQHLVVAGLFDVEDFSFQRQDGLEAPIAALFSRAAGGFSLHQKQFAAFRLALRTICQFAGKTTAIQRPFAPGEVAGLSRGFTRAGGLDRLVDDLSSDGWVLLEVSAQAFVHKCLDDAGNVGIQFAFGLSLKLRLRQLNADDGNQTLAHVVAGEIFSYVLEQTHLLPGVIDRAGQRHAEAREVRAPVHGVDVVGETKHRLRVGVVVLQPDFHDYAAALGFHVDGLVVQDLLAAIQMLDELGDAAVVFELGRLGFASFRVGGALIGEGDQQAFVQECQLAETLRQRVEVVFRGGKDASIGQEVNFRSKFLAGARFLQLSGGVAFGISLLPGEAIAPDFEIEFFAQSVDAGDADAVQSA